MFCPIKSLRYETLTMGVRKLKGKSCSISLTALALFDLRFNQEKIASSCEKNFKSMGRNEKPLKRQHYYCYDFPFNTKVLIKNEKKYFFKHENAAFIFKGMKRPLPGRPFFSSAFVGLLALLKVEIRLFDLRLLFFFGTKGAFVSPATRNKHSRENKEIMKWRPEG